MLPSRGMQLALKGPCKRSGSLPLDEKKPLPTVEVEKSAAICSSAVRDGELRNEDVNSSVAIRGS